MDKDSYKNMKKINSLNTKIKRVETEIIELEEKIKKNDLDLELNPTNHDENFFEEYQSRKNQLASTISKWEDLQKQLEKIEKK